MYAVFLYVAFLWGFFLRDGSAVFVAHAVWVVFACGGPGFYFGGAEKLSAIDGDIHAELDALVLSLRNASPVETPNASKVLAVLTSLVQNLTGDEDKRAAVDHVHELLADVHARSAPGQFAFWYPVYFVVALPWMLLMSYAGAFLASTIRYPPLLDFSVYTWTAPGYTIKMVLGFTVFHFCAGILVSGLGTVQAYTACVVSTLGVATILYGALLQHAPSCIGEERAWQHRRSLRNSLFNLSIGLCALLVGSALLVEAYPVRDDPRIGVTGVSVGMWLAIFWIRRSYLRRRAITPLMASYSLAVAARIRHRAWGGLFFESKRTRAEIESDVVVKEHEEAVYGRVAAVASTGAPKKKQKQKQKIRPPRRQANPHRIVVCVPSQTAYTSTTDEDEDCDGSEIRSYLTPGTVSGGDHPMDMRGASDFMQREVESQRVKETIKTNSSPLDIARGGKPTVAPSVPVAAPTQPPPDKTVQRSQKQTRSKADDGIPVRESCEAFPEDLEYADDSESLRFV